MEIVTKEVLDRWQCEKCETTEDGSIYFNRECHPKSSTWVSYFDGMLRIECAECGERILVIKL